MHDIADFFFLVTAPGSGSGRLAPARASIATAGRGTSSAQTLHNYPTTLEALWYTGSSVCACGRSVQCYLDSQTQCGNLLNFP